MVSLKLQKRLAAAVIKIGLNESSEVAGANSRQNVRKDGFIVTKPIVIHSKSRHQGHMAANVHVPSKVLWMRKLRVLRRLLRKYREAKQIGALSQNLFINFSNRKTRTQNIPVSAFAESSQQLHVLRGKWGYDFSSFLSLDRVKNMD